MDALGDVDVRELVEMVRVMKLSKELCLTDEETITLVKRHSEYKDKMNLLAKERQQTVAELKVLLKSDAEAGEVELQLEKAMQLDEKALKAASGGIKKIAEGLSVQQRAKLYVFMNEFTKDMRQLVNRVRERSDEMRRSRMGRQGMEGGEGPRRKDGGMGPGQPRDENMRPYQNRPVDEHNPERLQRLP